MPEPLDWTDDVDDLAYTAWAGSDMFAIRPNEFRQ